MAQGQSRATAIAAAFALIPTFVHTFRDQNTPGMTNEQRHQNVANLVDAVLILGGVAAGANNPALAPLINETIKATVTELHATNFAQPSTVAVPMPIDALPDDHPVTQAIGGTPATTPATPPTTTQTTGS